MAHELIDVIREESRMVTVIQEVIASGRATLYRYDGQFPYDVAVFDETVVGLLLTDDEENVRAMIDTDDAAVRSWVAATIDAHQREAERLDADAFTA